MKPKLLDLFCGAGLAAIGYADAGFEIVGVDNRPQPRYPYTFHCADAMEVLANPVFLANFDAIHASPPCQHYTSSTAKFRKSGKTYPDLLPGTRDLLEKQAKPWVIENVPGAPIRPDLILRGDVFGLGVLRRRFFEFGNWWAMQPQLPQKKGSVKNGDFVSIFGNAAYRKDSCLPVGWRPKFAKRTIKETWHFALGLPEWFRPTDVEMSEGIPPAYTKYIGQILKEHIARTPF